MSLNYELVHVTLVVKTNVLSYLENGPFLICPYGTLAPGKSFAPWVDRNTGWWAYEEEGLFLPPMGETTGPLSFLIPSTSKQISQVHKPLPLSHAVSVTRPSRG